MWVCKVSVFIRCGFWIFADKNTQVWILSSELTSHKLFNPLSRPLPSPVSLPFSLSLSPTTNLSVYLSPSRNIVATSTSTSGSKKKSTSTTLPHSHTSKISRIEFVNPFNLFRTKSFLNPVLVQIKSTFHFFSSKQKKPLSHFVSCLNLAIELEIYWDHDNWFLLEVSFHSFRNSQVTQLLSICRVYVCVVLYFEVVNSALLIWW